jgi:putative membrane protein
MRFVYLALIVIATIVMLLFKFPDIETVKVSFLSLTGSLPVAVVLIVVYVLGIIAGGALLAFLRSIVRRSAPKRY